eukprot:jgi/Tetstr1/443818/TSEL_003272.t1
MLEYVVNDLNPSLSFELIEHIIAVVVVEHELFSSPSSGKKRRRVTGESGGSIRMLHDNMWDVMKEPATAAAEEAQSQCAAAAAEETQQQPVTAAAEEAHHQPATPPHVETQHEDRHDDGMRVEDASDRGDEIDLLSNIDDSDYVPPADEHIDVHSRDIDVEMLEDEDKALLPAVFIVQRMYSE